MATAKHVLEPLNNPSVKELLISGSTNLKTGGLWKISIDINEIFNERKAFFYKDYDVILIPIYRIVNDQLLELKWFKPKMLSGNELPFTGIDVDESLSSTSQVIIGNSCYIPGFHHQ